MDLLIEKLDGSRYYLSQYKVLITEFEESAPSVTRNSMQLNQRNGNIDFGGWHTDKTINITGYYRADDMDEEEALREKLYALLSNPDGYYITQLKTSPERAVERPGETSGGYYDKLNDYPSHKRFLVYAESPEVELVGNVNGTLLYKLTAEFKTMKLPYGETPVRDVVLNDKASTVGTNLYTDTNNFDNPASWHASNYWTKTTDTYNGLAVMQTTGRWNGLSQYVQVKKGDILTYSVYAKYASGTGASTIYWKLHKQTEGIYSTATTNPYSNQVTLTDSLQRVSGTTVATSDGYLRPRIEQTPTTGNTLQIAGIKLEKGTTASPWSPNPADPEYNSWRYSLSGNVSIPYSGTVPCNQLEQQFAIELTAMGASSSLSFKIDDTELTYSGGVASGDVFIFSGFSYTKNGLSIVSKTNKAYFILQPDKPNRITCNVPGRVRIIGFQNLYA